MTAALLRLVSRHRRSAVLCTTLLVAFLTLTLQARQDSVPVAFVKRALLMTVAPFIKATAWVGGGVRTVWSEYVDLRGLQAENRRLRAEGQAGVRRGPHAGDIAFLPGASIGACLVGSPRGTG